jgi:cell division protein FtsW
MFSRSFQPSDITKVAIVVYLAIVLGKNFNGSIKQFFMWTIFPVLLVCGLVIKAHTSNAVIIGATSMLMVFIGVSKRKFRLISILFVVATMTLYLCFYKDVGRGETVSKRIKAWVVTTFSPETRTIAEEKEDPKNQTAGYRQARIARYAIVSGGLFHIAPGKSVYRKILSEAHNDYIFAIIVEEYGLTGGIIVIMVYFVLFYRIIRLLKRCRKTFTALMLSGLLIMIVLPTCIHIGVAVGGLPVVGQNLPMISTGGTSIITTSIAFGMILAVSRIAEEEEKEKELQKSKTET